VFGRRDRWGLPVLGRELPVPVVVVPLAADRVPTIRRDWAVSAAAYLVVLIPAVALASRLF
jgi:hypothetical protein